MSAINFNQLQTLQSFGFTERSWNFMLIFTLSGKSLLNNRRALFSGIGKRIKNAFITIWWTSTRRRFHSQTANIFMNIQLAFVNRESMHSLSKQFVHLERILIRGNLKDSKWKFTSCCRGAKFSANFFLYGRRRKVGEETFPWLAVFIKLAMRTTRSKKT